ncbi:MAG: hypothetical protein ACLR9T_11975 [Thomasclavelia sp.]|uniref:hypothetical protein n=1 Tax=Thomasclavelia sp. TaxID=3025757 RepID=UPI0039A2371B
MSFQDKYSEYKQRKEARAFFNKNNNEKICGKDYVVAIGIGMGVSIVLGFIMEWITFKIGFNFSYFTILVGILQAMAIKKVLRKSGVQLAVTSVVTYLLGIIIAQALYVTITLPVFSVELFIEMFKMCFKFMIVGDFLDTIIYLLGAAASYMALKD